MRAKEGFSAEDAVELIAALEDRGLEIWVDGGWAVDALLGGQTRPHQDLDIVIRQKDLSALREFLEARGYADVPREDTSPWNFVMGDAAGRLVDTHVIRIDEHGNGLYGPPESDFFYPAASLTGEGKIGGRAMRCISPEWLVRFHTGYPLRESDYHDVLLLCRKFHLEPPAEYRSSLQPGMQEALDKAPLEDEEKEQ